VCVSVFVCMCACCRAASVVCVCVCVFSSGFSSQMALVTCETLSEPKLYTRAVSVCIFRAVSVREWLSRMALTMSRKLKL